MTDRCLSAWCSSAGWRQVASIASLLTASVVALPAAHPALSSAPPRRSTRCVVSVLPSRATRVTALPPHQSWPRPLPNDRRDQWSPIAADGTHVLMEWLPYPPPSGASRVGLAIATKSGHLNAVASAAYPHHGIFERWSLEYPWVVGVLHTLPQPVDWKLWAGNVVTGRHVILDHGNGPNSTNVRQYPDFALNAGRVIWDDTAYENGPRNVGAVYSRLDVYDLRTRHKSFIAYSTDPRLSDTQPTLYGNTVVWVRTTQVNGAKAHPIADLLRFQLDTGKVSNLTHNTQASGESGEPSLWRHFLLFKQSPSPYATGDVVLWDLNRPIFPLWRKPGETLLDLWGEMPKWSGGVAWWQAEGQSTSAIYVAGTKKVWTFEYGPHTELPRYYKYNWLIQVGAGGTFVVKRSLSGLGGPPAHPTFFVWQIPHVRAGPCP